MKPALVALVGWCALALLGGRAATAVLAGEVGGVQGALGLCYGVAWLAAIILGPIWLSANLLCRARLPWRSSPRRGERSPLRAASSR
jgi:hypothetical protein